MTKRIFALLLFFVIILSGCADHSTENRKNNQDAASVKLRNNYKMNILDIGVKKYDTDSDGNLALYDKAPYYNVFDKMYIEYRENIYNDNRLIKLTKKYDKTFRAASDNKDFIISDYKSGVCINKYLGKEENIKIPDTLDGKKVIKLGAYIYYNFSEEDNYYSEYASPFASLPVVSDIKSITLPKYLKYISYQSLYGVSLMGNNSTAGEAFQTKHTMENIYVDKENPYYASFDGMLYSKDKTCLLQIPLNYKKSTIDIAQGTKAVYAVSAQTTKTLKIPSSVISFGESINKNGDIDYDKDYPSLYNYPLNTDEVKNIRNFIVDENNAYYSSESGVLFDKNKTTLIAYPFSNQRTEYTVPESVSILGDFDFYPIGNNSGNLKEITIGKNVKKIYSILNTNNIGTVKTIKGYKGTVVEKYAKKNKLNFVALD